MSPQLCVWFTFASTSGGNIERQTVSCADIDECGVLKEIGASCGGESRCINGLNHYTCECAEGWTGGGVSKKCDEIDECDGVDCGGSSSCQDGIAKYTCQCAPGWRSRGENKPCADASGSCSGPGQVGGKGTCRCRSGYDGVPQWEKDKLSWDNPCSLSKPTPRIINNLTTSTVAVSQFVSFTDIFSSDNPSYLAVISMLVIVILLVIGLVVACVFLVMRSRHPGKLPGYIDAKTVVVVPVPSANKAKLLTLMTNKNFSIPFDELKVGPTIHKGSMGRVCRGEFQGSPVAVKELAPSFYNSTLASVLKAEVSKLSSLHHRNIVRFHGMAIDPFCKQRAYFHLVMDLKHTDLRRVVKHTSQPGVGEVMRMASEICAALEFLHAHNVVHRDLRPEHILLDEQRSVFLCNFGISKPSTDVTDSTTDLGTSAFTAPELTMLKDAIDFPETQGSGFYGDTHISTTSTSTTSALVYKVDCYSFALVLWVLLRWSMPFPQLTPVQILASVAYYQRRPSITGIIITDIILTVFRRSYFPYPTFSLSFCWTCCYRFGAQVSC